MRAIESLRDYQVLLVMKSSWTLDVESFIRTEGRLSTGLFAWSTIRSRPHGCGARVHALICDATRSDRYVFLLLRIGR